MMYTCTDVLLVALRRVPKRDANSAVIIGTGEHSCKVMLKPIMTNLVQKSISAADNQLSCANGCDTSRHIQGNGKRKGMFHSLP